MTALGVPIIADDSQGSLPAESKALEPRRVKRLKPRPHQIRLDREAGEILARADHAYVEAPTSVGKSLVIAMIGERFKDRDRYYLVGSRDLVLQARSNFEDYVRSGVVKDLSRWRFMTWRSFQARSEKILALAAAEGAPRPIALVDECHKGGSVSNDDKVCFPAIVRTAAKRVWVSATPWRVDEKTLGTRDGHTALMTFLQAYEEKLLNPVDLYRIDCGLMLRGAVSAIERSEKRSINSLGAEAFEIEADTAAEGLEQLDALTQSLLGRKLQVSDVKSILRHRGRLLADVYLEKHKGEKAMFFCTSQALARELADYIDRRMPMGQRAISVVCQKGATSAETRLLNEHIENFRNGGHIRVVCVVHRLREGFDCDDLALGFDASWSPTGMENTTQKIGRFCRRAPQKPTSRYYYAVDVATIAGARGRELNLRLISAVATTANLGADQARSVAEALVESAALASKMADQSIKTSAIASHETMTIAGEVFQATRVPLFQLDDASGKRAIAQFSLAEAFSKSEEAKDLAELVFVETILKKGALPKPNTADGKKLRLWTTPLGEDYRPWIRHRLLALLEQTPGFYPEQNREHWALVESETLGIEMGGPRPSSLTPGGFALSRALRMYKGRAAQGVYSSEVVRRRLQVLNRRDIWVDEQSLRRAEEARDIERIIPPIEGGADVPEVGSPDREKFDQWVSLDHRNARPAVRTRILRTRPELVPGVVAKLAAAEKEREALEACFISLFQEGRFPASGTEASVSLQVCLEGMTGNFERFLRASVEALNGASFVSPKLGDDGGFFLGDWRVLMLAEALIANGADPVRVGRLYACSARTLKSALARFRRRGGEHDLFVWADRRDARGFLASEMTQKNATGMGVAV